MSDHVRQAVVDFRPGGGGIARRELAASRISAARSALANCQLCALRCGANRLAEGRGPCGAGLDTSYFTAQLESGDELQLTPTFAIALSGCNLRCKFCITGESSWNPRAGRLLDIPTVVNGAIKALERGARSIMVLGGEPTIHCPALLSLVSTLPDSARLAIKTNGYYTLEARELLGGLFDDWVIDYKFGNNTCAASVAMAQDYLPVLHENLAWAATNSHLIIRHLLLPGHVDCCWQPIARWIATNIPDVELNLNLAYWPAWQALRCNGIGRLLSDDERRKALVISREFSLNLIQ